MKIFYCPCEGELDCVFYNPRTGRCEMNDPVNNCDVAFYAVEEANENQPFCPGRRRFAQKLLKIQTHICAFYQQTNSNKSAIIVL